MKTIKFVKSIVFASSFLFASFASADTIVKTPDLSDAWRYLSNSGSDTYIYASSFIAPTTGFVNELGTWLNGGGTQELKFQIFESVEGMADNGPDSQKVLASSGIVKGNHNTLTFVNVTNGISSAKLSEGETYWFAATAFGMDGEGKYNVGGHTPNSVIKDGGKFWYSNDGINFDNQVAPEMAFSVSVSPVPEAETYAMLLAGLGLIGVTSRRRKLTMNTFK